MIKYKTQTESDSKIGWAIQKSILNFRTQSLRPAVGLSLWDPVTVKVSQILPGVATPFSNQSLLKGSNCIPSGP